MDMTMASSRKLTPRWSAPRQVVSKIGNSYTLTSLEGFPLGGLFHVWCLQHFILHNGTTLAALQAALQGDSANEEVESEDVELNIQEEWEDMLEEDSDNEGDAAVE